MRFPYVIINFLLLAGIIYLVGGKSIAAMFRARREAINAGLDLAETPFTPEPLPDEAPEETPVRSEAQDTLWNDRKETFRELDAEYEKNVADRRREMLLQTRTAIISRVLELTAGHMASEEYRRELRSRQADAVDRILRRIRLTNGDRSYMARKGQLYVTLTYSNPMDEELVATVREKATELVESEGGKISFLVKQDMDLIGGCQLRIGDTIYDYSVANKLYRLGRALNERPLTETDARSMLSGMLEAVEGMDLDIDVFQVGRVISVSDGICWLDGLADIMYGELVEFVTGQRGMVMELQPDRVGCIIFGRYDHVESYSRVRRLNIMASVPVGEALLGRVVDALGEPIDGRGRLWTNERRPIEYQAPAIPDRQSVGVPLHTGIKAIDALVPIGRGQRELIIGDRQTGKTAIAIDAILNQRDTGVVCIYVAIGQKQSSVAQIARQLEESGAMDHTIIVSATASDSASLQYIAPFAGAAMSEYFMYRGRDVLIVYDDLSKHAVAYRELSLLLHRPAGREAYPGDIFYLHSRLLERAARLSVEAGGGSVTALPIIETQAGDISAYIPTNVISITDGQIFLETDLFNEGQRPAINVGLSVSRVGGAAQTPLLKQASGQLRTNLAQYRELAVFSQFGSDLDEATKKVLASGERMMAALRQDRYSPLADWQQALLILSVAGGFADAVEPGDMGDYAQSLFTHFTANESSLVETLSTGKKLDAAAREALHAALRRFAEAYRHG